MPRNIITSILVLLFVVLGSSCEKSGNSDGLVGTWRCSETYSGNSYRTYNVIIDQLSDKDSTMFVIYNMYNIGMDFETYAQLSDSVFSIISGSNPMYILGGTGKYTPSTQTIEWTYSISGGINDPVVIATYEKD
ncbi:MAG: hypothetical protein AB7S48_05240 [Bacteroidales bacterium]